MQSLTLSHDCREAPKADVLRFPGSQNIKSTNKYYRPIIMGSGGRREGSGRKRIGKRAVQFKLSPESVRAVKKSAPPGTRSALVEQILGNALGVHPLQVVEPETQAKALRTGAGPGRGSALTLKALPPRHGSLAP
jgi:hypothetical protein